jgi:hypothetical protein
MPEEVFFDKPIHLNRFSRCFDLEDEANAHILDNLYLSIDGSILGVKLEPIKKFFSDEEVRGYRYGLKKMPKGFEVKTEEDFYRMMAILTPLSEY